MNQSICLFVCLCVCISVCLYGCLFVCMAVCLFYVSAVFYARPHLSVDPDETVQGNPECPSDGHIGVGCETTRGGWGCHNFKKDCSGSCNRELFCFVCHLKDSNYAYSPTHFLLDECRHFKNYFSSLSSVLMDRKHPCVA